jgi:hypothetical protein
LRLSSGPEGVGPGSKPRDFPLAGGREHGHIGGMSKSPRVTFRPKRIAEGEWQIEAHYPGEEVRIISGLTSKADIDDWLNGTRKIAWLRSQGYAK